MPTLKAVADRLDQHLIECTAGNNEVRRTLGVLMQGHEAIEDAIASAKRAAWRGFLAVLGVLAVSAGTVLVQNYTLTQTRVSKADVMGTGPTARYTAADAARDRAAQAERDVKLLEALNALKRRR